MIAVEEGVTEMDYFTARRIIDDGAAYPAATLATAKAVVDREDRIVVKLGQLRNHSWKEVVALVELDIAMNEKGA
jgi:hypothetical protein